ncbi:MAG TPA: aldolase/citrate lyase family protein [Armatimonadota bacterium]|nr:aldolase/citrate lyase family protein [Armatimonadota bacterium]HOS42331.1 aldolase/citrate lyase family protein [Armatimonadota bacterium]
MKKSVVREKMRRGDIILTAKLNFMNPNLAELIGYFGFDCLWICNEHQGIDRAMLENIIRTAKITGMDMMIRTGFGAHTDLIQPLEMGAQGLMIPHIASVAQVEEIVRAAKFHPVGLRGMDCVNGDADQGMAPTDDYLEFARNNTFIAVQIEDEEALAQVDRIAAVPGLDMIFLGPKDFSQAAGVPGAVRHPRVWEAILRCSEACGRHGIYCATSGLGDPAYMRRLIEHGVKFLTGPSDYGAVVRGLKADVERYGELGFTFRPYHPLGG